MFFQHWQRINNNLQPKEQNRETGLASSNEKHPVKMIKFGTIQIN